MKKIKDEQEIPFFDDCDAHNCRDYDNLPSYATLCIDEAQAWFSSRDGHVENDKFSLFRKALFGE